MLTLSCSRDCTNLSAGSSASENGAYRVPSRVPRSLSGVLHGFRPKTNRYSSTAGTIMKPI